MLEFNMNHKAGLLASLIVSGLCLQCVTPKTGMELDKGTNVFIECKYINMNRTGGMSEVECIIENNGNNPEIIGFEKISLSDPHSTVIPVDANKIRKGQALQTVIVVLGVVVILGALVALASKGKSSYIPSVHVSIPDTPPAARTVTTEVDSRKPFSIDTIQIAAHGSANLAFKIKHETIRPKALVLQLRGVEQNSIEVPIKDTFRKSRSNFDY
jgi:hypothetical protein